MKRTITLAASTRDSKLVKPFTEIPGPFQLPFIGNLYLYKLGYYKVSKYHVVLKELFEKYGPIVREKIGQETVVHVFDPDDVKIVHSVGGKTPKIPPLMKAAQLYRQERELSPGLGNVNGEEWYRLRSAVQQMMMRPKEVSHYLPFADQVSKNLVCKITEVKDSNHEVKDLRLLISKWNLESSGMVCFEKRLGCLGENENMAEKLIEANVDIFHLSACLKFSLGFHNYFTTPKWRKFLVAEDYFYKKATEFINETVEKVNLLSKQNKLEPYQYNFMSYLLSRQDLSPKDVEIITLSLFADGLSTTTPALLFNLYCMAKYQESQDELYREVSNLSHLTVDIMNKLQYLKAFVKETFRMHPGGTEVSRILPVDLILGNFQVPKGTHVDLNQFVHFTSPEYFKEPYAFLPDRWLRESQGTKIQHHPYLLTPFGHGTRMCAGRRFAEQDLYTSITRICQNFHLELVKPEEEMEKAYSTLLFPKYPLRIKFIPR